MKFTLTINMDNAAFGDDLLAQRQELSRLLKFVSEDVYLSAPQRKVRDVNGNTVGEWRITAGRRPS